MKAENGDQVVKATITRGFQRHPSGQFMIASLSKQISTPAVA
jgi:hypothetical protein